MHPKFIRFFNLLPLKTNFAKIAFYFAQRWRTSCYNRHIFRGRRRNLLLPSLAAGFSFQTIGISDEEMAELDISTNNPFEQPDSSENWEIIYQDEQTKVYRRRLNERGIFEYRCIGSYSDISPADFIQAQYDVEYRQKWDDNIKSLEVLEEEAASGSQVIRWETKYPYPMNPRLYIYVQRKSVDVANKIVMIVNRAMDETAYPEDKKNSSVRITEYSSKLYVRAHTEMDQNGLDFVLIYHDDPKAPIPKKAYEFGVNVIGPRVLTEMHNAARKLAEKRNRKENAEPQS